MESMISLIFHILWVCSIITSGENIKIETTLGLVRGKLVNDVTTGAHYYSFEGIPYAEPPVGNLRFKPPVQKQAWCNIFDATKPGHVCPQIELYHSKEEMNEDCLNFNIYTPANYLHQLLPVLFIIHAGDFNLLSGKTETLYGPQLFILSDVVVVSMNYRLGALGFLSLCTEEISGNAGVKDVLLALKIVHKNINRFGGDPNRITITGKGAGAAMTQLLMLTNQSIGLFQNVLLSSGSVLSTKYMQLYPRKNAILLGQELGLDLSNDDCMLEQLRNFHVFDIIKAQEAVGRRNPQRVFRNFSPFKPTVEVECESAIITRPPLEMIKEGAIHDIPMVLGFNNQEGVEMFLLLREEPELIDRLNDNFELSIPEDIQYPFGSVARRNLAARIRNFYFDGGNISFVNIQNYVNFISDTQYTFSIDFLINLFKEKKKAPVYYYVFSADTVLNFFKAFANITYSGAAHFDDIGYFYVTSITKAKYKYLDPIAKGLLSKALQIAKSFIYYGVPSPNWPEAGRDRHHVIFDYNSVEVFRGPLTKRIGFWYDVYEEYFRSKWYTGAYFCTKDEVHL